MFFRFTSQKTIDFVPKFTLHLTPILSAEIIFDYAETHYNNGNRLHGRPLHPWKMHKVEDIWDIDLDF